MLLNTGEIERGAEWDCGCRVSCLGRGSRGPRPGGAVGGSRRRQTLEGGRGYSRAEEIWPPEEGSTGGGRLARKYCTSCLGHGCQGYRPERTAGGSVARWVPGRRQLHTRGSGDPTV
ncbi:hypothetical protein NDU88_006206 [Pleurodeles waltl]|uniref:Uncharacterized protein n=1 Tax=Pleurodeles waltl TaxID=8319 RepID=A0AAV7TWZ9_PLEWA|nr:hypothetical protein NDU88_006206 [Pleurodeles waltl]